ncbi:antibiotic biosynthesis monooxygenase [Pseudonocardiaceae bacterium YIM PH 21723]|nr:antibiotic biosynthesis monooxygenase [Pseudonocardiaceae bacterium YIM PH 21723]
MSDGITVLVARRVEAGHEAEFEDWAAGILAAAARHPGHLGHGLLRPEAPGEPWHLLHRFRDAESYRAWMRSPERAAHFDRAGRHHAETARRELHGVEAWFAVAPGAPPRWKLAVVSGAGILPVSLTANLLLGPLLGGAPLVVRTMLFAVLFSLLMTYLVLPNLTRLLRGWLYPPGERR